MQTPIPLCVDLDGTLLRTDTMREAVLLLLKESPLAFFQLPLWLGRGRANLIHEIASRVELDTATLPLNIEFLAFLQQEHQSGRKLLLVSGTDQKFARAMAERVGLFTECCASDGKTYLSGRGKADMLVKRFGKGGFDYAGNARVDLAVWAQARRAIVVSNSRALTRKAESLCEVEQIFRLSAMPPGCG
ncbi:MAG: hypothetical protein ABJF10_05340 [Chthoniobacter sp.]|uniref:hypothetical protein n=1 Tax=Chthoniobacter sp. TaxID=2510640 RepID=UPI0032AC814B